MQADQIRHRHHKEMATECRQKDSTKYDEKRENNLKPMTSVRTQQDDIKDNEGMTKIERAWFLYVENRTWCIVRRDMNIIESTWHLFANKYSSFKYMKNKNRAENTRKICADVK